MPTCSSCASRRAIPEQGTYWLRPRRPTLKTGGSSMCRKDRRASLLSVIAPVATTRPLLRSFSTARRWRQACGCRLRDVPVLEGRLPFVEDWRAATFHPGRPRQLGNLLRRRMARDCAPAYKPPRSVGLSLYVRRDRPCDIPFPGAAAPHDRLSLRIGREQIELYPPRTMRSSSPARFAVSPAASRRIHRRVG